MSQEAEYARIVADEAIRQKEVALARVAELEAALERVRVMRHRMATAPQGDGYPPEGAVWLLDQVLAQFTALDSETKTG